MSDYHPPIQSGITGDRYLEDDLRPHLGTGDLSEAHTPGCYALLLSTPYEWQRVVDAWEDAHDAPMTPWVRDAFETERVLYVGAAKNVFERLTEHADGENLAALEKVFPPHSVWDVWLYGDVDKAFLRESQIALELHTTPGLFAHQR